MSAIRNRRSGSWSNFNCYEGHHCGTTYIALPPQGAGLGPLWGLLKAAPLGCGCLLKTINRDLSTGSREPEDLQKLYPQFWSKLEEKRDNLLGAALYTKNVIFVPDLAKDTPLISGQTFEDIVFKGPAVLALLEHCVFSQCFFGLHSDVIESILWERKPNIPFIGAIGISRCNFNRCNFEGIGFTGPKEILDGMRIIHNQSKGITPASKRQE